MNGYREILNATVSQFEHAERLRRSDPTFDGWHFVAAALGHKSASTLRKMCEEPSDNNKAKLGFNEAIIVMTITDDYRLLHYAVQQLRELRRRPEASQLSFFSEPIHEIKLTL